MTITKRRVPGSRLAGVSSVPLLVPREPAHAAQETRTLNRESNGQFDGAISFRVRWRGRQHARLTATADILTLENIKGCTLVADDFQLV